MRIVRIFPKTTTSSKIIELENNRRYCLTATLLAELEHKLKEIEASNIEIDSTEWSCEGIEKITTYDNLGKFGFLNEDLKAVIKA